MTNTEIRRRILQILYERFAEHPYNRTTPSEFKENLDIGLKALHFNIIYLEEKGYVELSKPLEGSVFVAARITPKGIDLVEDEYEFSILHPEESEAGPVTSDILEKFETLINETIALTDISDDSKELIIEEIRAIQNELRKHEPVYSEIKQKAVRLRNRNFDIWQKLIKIIKHPTVAKILGHAARKELGI